MGTVNAVKPEKARSFSLQAEIIRQIQINDGKTACYATPDSNQCSNKECGWRRDCLDEARKRGK